MVCRREGPAGRVGQHGNGGQNTVWGWGLLVEPAVPTPPRACAAVQKLARFTELPDLAKNIFLNYSLLQCLSSTEDKEL